MDAHRSRQANAPRLRPAVPPQHPPASLAAPRPHGAVLLAMVRGLARPLLAGVGCLAVTALGTLTLHRLWPEVDLKIAAGVSAVLFTGLTLWWPNRGEVGAKTNLGAALLAGTLVAVAVFAVQANLENQRLALSEQQARERAAATERQTLRLSIGLQRDLTGMDLSGQNLTGFYMRGKNLTDADLTDATLTGAVLAEAKASNVVLTGADLRGVSLDGADLTEADLSGANLSGTELFDTNLTSALLAGTNLRGTHLFNVKLAGAQLSGADLTGADLRDAYLKGADLQGAVTAGGTRWPPGFDWRAAGVTRG
jgi:uncharacterized protein YjbI with pentapeptide repeats